jgi:hypothetical protein
MWDGELQIPPLRYASVGMTKSEVVLPLGFAMWDGELQIPPLRYASVGMTKSVRNGQERVEAVFNPLGWVEMRVAHRSRVIAFESIPQRLKPLFLVGFDGGAEAPPLQKDPQTASRELERLRET